MITKAQATALSVISTMPTGTVCTIVSGPQYANNRTWYEVDTPYGRVGYRQFTVLWMLRHDTFAPNRPAVERTDIPGWGVDLDYEDRPAVPMEDFDPGATNAHWDFPELQPEKWPREMSPEHGVLPPVFGTSSWAFTARTASMWNSTAGPANAARPV